MVLSNVVVIGNCGTGKSTCVEKVSGTTGLAGSSMHAVTKTQKRLPAKDGSFCIVDTPGQNPLKDALQDNLQVAMALNQGPVSLMLITTKADIRLEEVVEQLDKYMERFVDFVDIVCIMVTCMDKPGIEWSEKDCRDALDEQFGVTKVIFTGLDTSAETLIQGVRSELVEPRTFDIGSDNFLQYFKICKKKVGILKKIKDRVNRYRKTVSEWKAQLSRWDSQVQADQVFQFNTFMTNEIAGEQDGLAGEFGWDFLSPQGDIDVEQQVGYIASMASQMRAELFQVRVIVASHHSDANVGTLRKCPLCGIIWGKWEGCDSATTCGARPSSAKEFRNGVFHGFTFIRAESLQVEETAAANRPTARTSGDAIGCGGSITWSAMEPVTAGAGWTMAEIQGSGATAAISVTDVKSLMQRGQDSFDKIYAAALLNCQGLSAAVRTSMIAGGGA